MRELVESEINEVSGGNSAIRYVFRVIGEYAAGKALETMASQTGGGGGNTWALEGYAD